MRSRKALTRLGVDNTAAVEYGKLLFEDRHLEIANFNHKDLLTMLTAS